MKNKINCTKEQMLMSKNVQKSLIYLKTPKMCIEKGEPNIYISYLVCPNMKIIIRDSVISIYKNGLNI